MKICLFLVFFILTVVNFCHVQAGTFTVDYTNHVFLKDGQPFRHPVHPGLWNDRLQRIRAMGMNAIQVLIPWNLHEPTPGNFDFSGGLNISNFFTLAQQNGLNVLLRPGPYICAEFEHGGLPYWLLKYDNIKMRTSDTNFTNAVTSYWTRLLAEIRPHLYTNGGPILMVQIENEYGSLGACDQKYTYFLRDLLWSHLGNDTQLYTTDSGEDKNLKCGAVNGTLPTVDFGITEDATIDWAFGQQYKYSGGGPTVCSEYWMVWFMMWGQTFPRSADLAKVTDNYNHMWNANASINIYMIHGGTNFGFMNGAEWNGPIVTSYDYGASIAENGDITPMYHTIYNCIGNFSGWTTKQLPIPANNPASNYGPVTLKRVGANLISTLTQIQETCQQGQDPINFEHLDHAYGYVLYTTILEKGGKNLSMPNIKDYGFVFVNNVLLNPNGPLGGYNGTTSLLINAQAGDTLRIIVEEGGRINYWNTEYPYLDLKGLHTGVTLDGSSLTNWYSCGINLTKASIDSLVSSSFTNDHLHELPEKAFANPPGVYVGHFSASQLTDTFFDSTGWGKGQLFVNGYNLGRYWPLAGPQITLYVPSPYIQPNNTIVLIELIGSQQTTANFIDHATYKYSSSEVTNKKYLKQSRR